MMMMMMMTMRTMMMMLMLMQIMGCRYCAAKKNHTYGEKDDDDDAEAHANYGVRYCAARKKGAEESVIEGSLPSCLISFYMPT